MFLNTEEPEAPAKYFNGNQIYSIYHSETFKLKQKNDTINNLTAINDFLL